MRIKQQQGSAKTPKQPHLWCDATSHQPDVSTHAGMEDTAAGLAIGQLRCSCSSTSVERSRKQP